MRNYLFTRGMFWQIPYFDDTHTPAGQVPAYAIGRNDVDLKSEIDIQNNLLLSSLPPNWTIEPFYPNEAITMYFVLDKDSLMVTIKAFAPQFVSDVVANQPPAFPILANPKQSPRKTGWTDPAGVKRSPTPSDKRITRSDFSGAAGLVEFINNLPAYAAILKKEGRLRDAGIVLFVYNQVVDGRMTITDGLAMLRANGL